MNVSHGQTGWIAAVGGLDLATAVGLVSWHPLAAAYVGVVAAGAATAPDMDQPGGAPSRSFGPLSMLLARLLAAAGARIQQATRTPLDYVDGDGHRTITHGHLAALSMGAVIGLVCWGLGTWAVVATGYVFGALALRAVFGRKGTARLWARGLRRVAKVCPRALARPLRRLAKTAYRWEWITTNLTALGLALAGPAFVPPAEIGALGPVLGVTIAVGMFVHCLGDCPSVLGCPLWAPWPIKGRRWYRVRFHVAAPLWVHWLLRRRIVAYVLRDRMGIPERPRGQGFRVGGPLETKVIRPVLVACCWAVTVWAAWLAWA